MKIIRHFKYVVIIAGVWSFSIQLNLAQDGRNPSIIPFPASMQMKKGHFELNTKTSIVVPDNNPKTIETAIYLAEQIKTLNKLLLQIIINGKPGKNAIILDTDFASDTKGSYHLTIDKKSVFIHGSDDDGIFYGVQTFLQYLGNTNGQDKIALTAVDIVDTPAFVWRGMHLDVSRHFFPVEFVKKMIDVLASYKMNMFHWHLTDDQGWRIEIRKYPRLTEVGAWRDETMVGHYTENDQKFDGIRYGGYYTQDQIRDVVAYAQKRHITIVPEIEMPGHAVAALSAYPEFSCTGGPFKVMTKWGVSEDVFCAGKDETFQFLKDVLDEVTSLFPGPYIHIGGDECPKIRWKACPICQQRIYDEGLKNEAELQSYFIKRMESFVASKGKKLIGWDEILEGGLPERATVMSWRGYEGGIEAAQTGHDVVMTPGVYCYFDQYQSEDQVNEPLAFGGYLPLEKVYSFNPIPPQLSAEGSRHILGAQANVWTEYISGEEQAEYMIFPRILALAEVLWSPKDRLNYKQFLDRLKIHFKILENKGIHYRPFRN